MPGRGGRLRHSHLFGGSKADIGAYHTISARSSDKAAESVVRMLYTAFSCSLNMASQSHDEDRLRTLISNDILNAKNITRVGGNVFVKTNSRMSFFGAGGEGLKNRNTTSKKGGEMLPLINGPAFVCSLKFI